MIYLNSLNTQHIKSVNSKWHNSHNNQNTQQIILDDNQEEFEITVGKDQKTVFYSIFSNKDKIIAYFIFFVWSLIFVDFVFWWINKTTAKIQWAFWINTLTVFWLPTISLYLFYFSLKQKEVHINNSIPPCRVAIICSKIPSESEELLIRTLEAMKDQDFPYPYDVWVADEDPTPAMLTWCQDNGVNISTRKYDSTYHNEIHPRKARTKEGNFMYFYDKFGYENYDFVSQFDADHAPEKTFLKEVIKYFQDPKVGYVSSPSITDGNTEDSWTVLARCHWESTMHGPIQSGCNNGFAPLMFGSHYTHRITALKDIGGIGPEIAEDHTTTMVYNAHGWQGAFARNAVAHGYGAVGLGDSMIQEYQWALVSMRALCYVTPQYFWRLNWRVKLQFLIWESWYPALIIATMSSYLLPVLALKTQTPILALDGYGFWWHYLSLTIIFVVYVIWLRHLRHLRPIFSWQVSWETAVFQILQFPWIMMGSLTGIIQVLTGASATKQIKITDKNEKVKSIPLTLYLPHILICIVNLWAILSTQNPKDAYGYYWFAWVVVVSHCISMFCGSLMTFVESWRHLTTWRSKLQYTFNNSTSTLSVLLLIFWSIVSLIHILTHYGV